MAKQPEEKIVELLEELAKWTKVVSIPKVKEVLETLLQTPEERLAYKYSNGQRTIREVSQLSGRDTGSLSRDWKKWERAGIAVSISVERGDRAKSLFDLEDFGIEIQVSKADETKQKKGLESMQNVARE